MAIMLLSSWALRRSSNARAERSFRWLHLLSSAAYSTSHGLNDAQKTMGIIAVLLYSTGYLSGDKDVYVSANQVRKFRLRKGDIVSGPIRPPRSKEKFPAVVRIDKVNGMSSEEAGRGPRSEANGQQPQKPILAKA